MKENQSFSFKKKKQLFSCQILKISFLFTIKEKQQSGSPHF